MARGSKKGKSDSRAKRMEAELEHLEIASLQTSQSEGGSSENGKGSLVPSFDWNETLDGLEKSRPGKRSLQMRRLNEALAATYLPDQVFSSRTTLITLLASSIEKGGMEESLLACRCLAQILPTLGLDELSVADYQQLQRSLRKTAASSAGELRSCAATTMGLLGFMGCGDDGEVEETEGWFADEALDANFDRPLQRHDVPEEGLFNGATASCEISICDAFESGLLYLEGLLRGWGLMATNWPSEILGSWDENPAQALLEFTMRCLIQDEGPNVRTPACLCLALLIEGKWRKFYGENPHAPRSILAAQIKSRYSDVFDLVHNLNGNDLKRKMHRGQSKDEKKDQRNFFQMLRKTLETGEGPSASICLGSRARTTVFNSWISFVRYEMFREALKGSTAAHMMSNPSVIIAVGAADRTNSVCDIQHTIEMNEVARSKQDLQNRNVRERQRDVGRSSDRRLKFVSVFLEDSGQ